MPRAGLYCCGASELTKSLRGRALARGTALSISDMRVTLDVLRASFAVELVVLACPGVALLGCACVDLRMGTALWMVGPVKLEVRLMLPDVCGPGGWEGTALRLGFLERLVH